MFRLHFADWQPGIILFWNVSSHAYFQFVFPHRKQILMFRLAWFFWWLATGNFLLLTTTVTHVMQQDQTPETHTQLPVMAKDTEYSRVLMFMQKTAACANTPGNARTFKFWWRNKISALLSRGFWTPSLCQRQTETLTRVSSLHPQEIIIHRPGSGRWTLCCLSSTSTPQGWKSRRGLIRIVALDGVALTSTVLPVRVCGVQEVPWRLCHLV